MKIVNKPSKKPKDRDDNKLNEFDPDDIFSSDNFSYRMAETVYAFLFFVSVIPFLGSITGSERNYVKSVSLYPLLFALLYLVVNGLKTTIKSYIVLYFIGVLMQVQILFLMNEYIVYFRKDNSIFDDISSIISSIQVEGLFLIIALIFIVQFSNFMMFCIYRKKNEITGKKVKNLEIYLILNCIVLLLSFAFSLVTPLYRFASVLIYPQLFIQYYLIKNQFETERIGVLKYFGYGVAMQIHTLLLMFIYRSTWNLDMFPNNFFSTPSIADIFYTLYVSVLSIVSLYYNREEGEIEAYLNHEHRKTTFMFGCNAWLLLFCLFLFSFEPGYPFAAVLLVIQFHAQYSLHLMRRYISYKLFLGLIGFGVLLLFQSLLLTDKFVIFEKIVEDNGKPGFFYQYLLIFILIGLLLTFIFQIPNFVIYMKYIRKKDEKEKLKNHRTIKVLFKLVLLVMVFLLMCSLISEQFRFVSMILIPQIFTQIYFVNVGIYAECSRFMIVLFYGMGSEYMMFLMNIILSTHPSDDEEKLETKASSSDSSHISLLSAIAATLFVQISNGISFYIHSKRNKKVIPNRNQNAFYPMFEDFFDCFESKRIQGLEVNKTQCIP